MRAQRRGERERVSCRSSIFHSRDDRLGSGNFLQYLFYSANTIVCYDTYSLPSFQVGDVEFIKPNRKNWKLCHNRRRTSSHPISSFISFFKSFIPFITISWKWRGSYEIYSNTSLLMIRQENFNNIHFLRYSRIKSFNEPEPWGLNGEMNQGCIQNREQPCPRLMAVSDICYPFNVSCSKGEKANVSIDKRNLKSSHFSLINCQTLIAWVWLKIWNHNGWARTVL